MSCLGQITQKKIQNYYKDLQDDFCAFMWDAPGQARKITKKR